MGIHLAEVSVFAGMTGKNRHFRDLSQQVLSGVVVWFRVFFVTSSCTPNHMEKKQSGPILKVCSCKIM